jgi:hypothetical protein
VKGLQAVKGLGTQAVKGLQAEKGLSLLR